METKKISELTMMETVSDAANVLVEENGEAKRVPANKLGSGLTVPVGSPDTLTWDGNTEGLETFDIYFKVSDAVPTTTDFTNGCTVTTSDGEEIPVSTIGSIQEGVIGDDNGFFMVVSEGAPGAPVPAGLYFSNIGEFYVKALTIPGYTGFPVQEKIAPSYLYQPDWNQTDETAADFFKNKPFGEAEEVIIPLSAVQLVFDASMGAPIATFPTTTSLSPGAEIDVTWDGTVYHCVAVEGGGMSLFGNLASMGLDGNGEPFLGFVQSGSIVIGDITTQENVMRNVSISANAVKKIDTKFMPFTCTKFYIDSLNGGYLYTDKDCTAKVTAAECLAAINNGMVYLSNEDMTFVYLTLVQPGNGYMVAKSALGEGYNFYTAEYTG